MKKLLIFVLSIATAVSLFAHAPLISIDDNNDGTIYIEGGFSNGDSAEGIECIVVKNIPYNGPEDTFKGKMIIFKGAFGADNSLTIPKPVTEKYEVYFNGGEGHVIGKKGPMLTENEKQSWEEKSKQFDYGDWKEFMTEK